MKLKITKEYCWHNTSELASPDRIVNMYFIHGIPFTWDELTEDEEWDYSLVNAANNHHKRYTSEKLYMASSYLIMEELHPCFFDIELENPEMLIELE